MESSSTDFPMSGVEVTVGVGATVIVEVGVMNSLDGVTTGITN